MLLAVEGGRFFSSSASGYSNGLNLLFFGHKKEEKEKPMKVTPWTQYHLVDQEPDPNHHHHNHLQLAANKNNRCGCGCASLACFGRPDTAPARPAREVVVKTASDLEKVEQKFGDLDCHHVEGEEGNSNGVTVNSLKSSLKRRGGGVEVAVAVAVSNDDDDEVGPAENVRRSVHWTDVTGGELCAIREFEPSEHSDSDDEFENSSGKTCACMIM